LASRAASRNYGDRGFALYLRRSFAKSMGYSGELLGKPVVALHRAGPVSTIVIA
jgi:hypothetical protein